MGIYDRYVLPRLIDFACGMGDVMKQRSLLVPRAHGRVLEIGLGTGLNLGFYDAAKVSAIVGVDPAAQMQALARERAAQIGIPVEMVALELGEIRAEAESFDTIVCEHGRAPDASVLAWQRRLTPWWKPLAGGCHLDRDMPALLREAGFRIDELEQGYLPGPRPMTYVYRGVAR